MKNLLFTFIAIFTFGFCFSQVSFEQQDVSYYKINGRVKQFVVKDPNGNEYHKFDKNGKETQMQKSLSNDMILIVDFSKNNTQAQVVEIGSNKLWNYKVFKNLETNEIYETWTDVLTNEDKTSVYLYSYDKKLLSEVVLKPVFDGETEMQHYTCSYFYDEDGYLAKTHKTDVLNAQIIVEDFICDRKGNFVQKNVSIRYIEEKSKPEKAYYVKYDKKGNEFERGLTVAADPKRQMESKIKYNWNSKIKKLKLYNEQGNASVIKNKYVDNRLTESLFTLPDGTEYYLLINKYDKNGNIIYSSIKYPAKSELSSEMKYEYVYDTNKNWIKQSISLDEKVSSVVEREIEYY
ncbi:MAG: hypothetical protein PHE33_03540 [Bacteroidales bacterium]|nr:hypothetical protein [Bacteroidales bacterium]